MGLLAERENGGIVVRLFWDERAEARRGRGPALSGRPARQAFTARPPRDRALHAFYHPNAYAPAELPEAA